MQKFYPISKVCGGQAILPFATPPPPRLTRLFSLSLTFVPFQLPLEKGIIPIYNRVAGVSQQHTIGLVYIVMKGSIFIFLLFIQSFIATTKVEFIFFFFFSCLFELEKFVITWNVFLFLNNFLIFLLTRMASKKSRQNHSIQHLLELPSSRCERTTGNQQEQQSTQATPRQVPVTVLHPTPKKVEIIFSIQQSGKIILLQQLLVIYSICD